MRNLPYVLCKNCRKSLKYCTEKWTISKLALPGPPQKPHEVLSPWLTDDYLILHTKAYPLLLIYNVAPLNYQDWLGTSTTSQYNIPAEKIPRSKNMRKKCPDWRGIKINQGKKMYKMEYIPRVAQVANLTKHKIILWISIINLQSGH